MNDFAEGKDRSNSTLPWHWRMVKQLFFVPPLQHQPTLSGEPRLILRKALFCCKRPPIGRKVQQLIVSLAAIH
jgi:hypothetical protein